MLSKPKQTLEKREKKFVYIGGVAQLAFVASILLSRLNIEGFDFLEGMLLGFSMVGNLAFLYIVGRKRREK